MVHGHNHHERRSRKPNTSTHAPAKKGGAGGSYTWGRPEDVVDFTPTGVSQQKVTTTTGAASSTQAHHMEARTPEVPHRTSENFPRLGSGTSLSATERAHGPGAANAGTSSGGAWLTWTAGQRKALQFAVATGAASSAILGACGAVSGAILGGAAGLATGAIPAIFTFGLSIPVGGILGAGMGTATGAAVGSTTGFVAGAAAGGGVYTRRGHLRRILRRLMASPAGEALLEKWHVAKITWKQGMLKCASVKKSTSRWWQQVTATYSRWWALTKDQASDAREVVKHAAEEPSVQVAAVSACSGAVVLGAGAGGAGFLAGGAVGAAAGVVPAIFTFGLSIPIGAAIGSGCGLLAGTAVGGTLGFVGGGAGGYTAYSKRAEILQLVGKSKSSATSSAGRVDGAAR